MLFQDLLNFIVAWYKSRRWMRLLFGSIVLLLLPATAIGLVIYGASLSRQVLGTRYLAMVSDDVDKSIAEAEDAAKGVLPEEDEEEEEDESESKKVLQVPLRRLLQIGNFNERVVFVVAVELAKQGRFSMASRLMREIAPLDDSGFPDAHSWMAKYQIASWNTPGEHDSEALLHDLEISQEAGIEALPALIAIHAKLLNDAGRMDDAYELLRRNSRNDLQVCVQFATAASELKRERDLKIAAERGRALGAEKVRSGEAQLQDFAALVRLGLLEEDFDYALSVANTAFKAAPNELEVRRLYSDALLAKHYAIAESLKDSINEDTIGELQYLDAALKVDSSNPRVTQEVARGLRLGIKMPERMSAILEKSLADGTANAVTHLLIAGQALERGDPESAIPHLRLSIRQMPNQPVALNNLAFALLNREGGDLEEAAKHVEAALRVPDSTPEVLASILDTKGQIELKQGDAIGAIDSLERAIRLDNSKIKTRRRLVEAYRSVGMDDSAEGQLRRIKELEEQAAAEESKTETAASQPTPAEAADEG